MKINVKKNGRPHMGEVDEPETSEFNVSCRRTIFRSMVKFIKRDIYKKYESGKMDKDIKRFCENGSQEHLHLRLDI